MPSLVEPGGRCTGPREAGRHQGTSKLASHGGTEQAHPALKPNYETHTQTREGAFLTLRAKPGFSFFFSSLRKTPLRIALNTFTQMTLSKTSRKGRGERNTTGKPSHVTGPTAAPGPKRPRAAAPPPRGLHRRHDKPSSGCAPRAEALTHGKSEEHTSSISPEEACSVLQGVRHRCYQR